MDFSDSDEQEQTVILLWKYLLVTSLKLTVVSYLTWAAVDSQEEQVVLWMSVTKFGESLHVLLVPLLRSCLRGSMPLSGAEKDIKIRWSGSSILCSQTADARRSSCLLPGCHHVLLIPHPACHKPCGWAVLCHLWLGRAASPDLLFLQPQAQLSYCPQGTTSGGVAPFTYKTMPRDLV